MTPDDIAAWADRAEARAAEGIMTSPGEPTRILVAALRLYAEAQKREKPPATRRSAAAGENRQI